MEENQENVEEKSEVEDKVTEETPETETPNKETTEVSTPADAEETSEAVPPEGKPVEADNSNPVQE